MFLSRKKNGWLVVPVPEFFPPPFFCLTWHRARCHDGCRHHRCFIDEHTGGRGGCLIGCLDYATKVSITRSCLTYSPCCVCLRWFEYDDDDFRKGKGERTRMDGWREESWEPMRFERSLFFLFPRVKFPSLPAKKVSNKSREGVTWATWPNPPLSPRLSLFFYFIFHVMENKH